jgi:hypothetical protein
MKAAMLEAVSLFIIYLHSFMLSSNHSFHHMKTFVQGMPLNNNVEMLVSSSRLRPYQTMEKYALPKISQTIFLSFIKFLNLMVLVPIIAMPKLNMQL